MKVVLVVFVIFSIKYVVSGGGNPCGQFTSSSLSIVNKFDIASKSQKENSFSQIEKLFNNRTMPIEQRGMKIYAVSDESKQTLDHLESKAYVDLGKLIDRDPNVIARKLLTHFNVTDFPFVCVMDEADHISLQTNLISRSIKEYANKCISELEA